MPSPRADINPEVLKWARRRARYSTHEAARKAGTRVERYESYEGGDKKPTIKQLISLAKAFRQPVGRFYLDSVPEEDEPLLEMRRLDSGNRFQESPSLATAIEDVIQRRDDAIQLYRELGDSPPDIDFSTSVDVDPEYISSKLRSLLGVNIDEQKEQDGYNALWYWRTLIEKSGALCFQIPEVSLDEMRGFAITRRPLPIIGINRKDSTKARIFTLLHEYGHILLDDSVLHESAEAFTQPDHSAERFCNRLAACTIIPKGDILSNDLVQNLGPNAIWSRRHVEGLASVYSVSPAVTLRRLYNLDRVADSVFFRLVEELDHYKGRSEPRTSGGNYYTNKISELGSTFSHLAFQTYYEDRISLGELSSILDIKANNVPALEERLYG
jgi:Zn-dependent peptidase ImmA (M78 family)/DNA-binding XRE family transcriptional regulator